MFKKIKSKNTDLVPLANECEKLDIEIMKSINDILKLVSEIQDEQELLTPIIDGDNAKDEKQVGAT